MELKDIAKKGPVLRLSSGLSFKLRLFNLFDEIWLGNNFPNEDDYIKLVGDGDDLTKIEDDEILRVIYHQIEDKTPFAATAITDIDENGEEKTTMMGGIAFLKAKIQTKEDAIALFNCLCELFVDSRPESVENSKKKMEKNQNGI